MQKKIRKGYSFEELEERYQRVQTQAEQDLLDLRTFSGKSFWHKFKRVLRDFITGYDKTP